MGRRLESFFSSQKIIYKRRAGKSRSFARTIQSSLSGQRWRVLNPLMDVHIKTAEQRTVTGTLAVDGWAVTFGTAPPHQRPVHQLHIFNAAP